MLFEASVAMDYHEARKGSFGVELKNLKDSVLVVDELKDIEKHPRLMAILTKTKALQKKASSEEKIARHHLELLDPDAPHLTISLESAGKRAFIEYIESFLPEEEVIDLSGELSDMGASESIPDFDDFVAKEDSEESNIATPETCLSELAHIDSALADKIQKIYTQWERAMSTVKNHVELSAPEGPKPG